MTAELAPLDMRKVPFSQRHATIFGTFDALALGAAMEIVVDHEPSPLYILLEATRMGRFEWRYLETGPELWRVRLTRTAATMPATDNSGCCGACSCSSSTPERR